MRLEYFCHHDTKKRGIYRFPQSASVLELEPGNPGDRESCAPPNVSGLILIRPTLCVRELEVWEQQKSSEERNGGKEGARREAEKEPCVYEKRSHACTRRTSRTMHPTSLFFGAAGAASSCSPATHARGLNHFPLSEEEPSKHMENITAGGGGSKGETWRRGRGGKEGEVNLTRGGGKWYKVWREREREKRISSGGFPFPCC